MKKGCFLTVIISLTVILVGVFYMVKYHGEDILEFGKNQLVEIAQNKIQKDIDGLSGGKYVDSLKIVVDNYFNKIDKLDVEKSLQRIEEFSDDFEVILMDSKIDSAEFDFITNILVRYEQRKEN